jgi:hypothetical protein
MSESRELAAELVEMAGADAVTLQRDGVTTQRAVLD